MEKSVTLPPGIGKEADGKTVKFQLPNCEGIGHLNIWASPTKPDRYVVQIEIGEQMESGPKEAFRFTTIDLSSEHALLLHKSSPGLPYEYEIST